MSNAALLETAEREGYEVLITTDRNLRYQQHLANRSLAIIVLRSTSWPLIKQRVAETSAAVNGVSSGDDLEIAIP